MSAIVNDRKARRLTMDQPSARSVRFDFTISPQIVWAIVMNSIE